MPYNPYNGNYYGDGSDVKRDSYGNAIANEKTGAIYTNFDSGTGSKFARSDDPSKEYVSGSGAGSTSTSKSHSVDLSGNSSKNTSDWYTDINQKFIDAGYSQNSWDAYYRDAVMNSGNQALIDRYNMNQGLIAQGKSPIADVKFDYRGFGLNGSYGVDDRGYWFDPATGQNMGNINMMNPEYNLMFDTRYDYGLNYFTDRYLETIKGWLANGEKLAPGETPESLAQEYARRWIEKNATGNVQPMTNMYSSINDFNQQRYIESVNKNTVNNTVLSTPSTTNLSKSNNPYDSKNALNNAKGNIGENNIRTINYGQGMQIKDAQIGAVDRAYDMWKNR